VAKVRLDLTRLLKFKQHLLAADAGTPGYFAPLFLKWAARYLSFAAERFDKFSKGGGDWPPLKESTIRRRRGQRTKKERAASAKKKGLRAAILVDTGTLKAALSPSFEAPGQVKDLIPRGVRVGFGGSAKHGGGVTIAELAKYHDSGMGRNPKREIIVQPSDKVLHAMSDDLVTHLQKHPDFGLWGKLI